MAAAVQFPVREGTGRPLPFGQRIELTRRGTTFVRTVTGPSDNAPTLLLLHGWCASAGLNWYQVFEPLAQHFNLVAPDLRGHARGLRTRKVFRLSDCADDCAATIEQLGTGPVIAVGYSMGGPVAQLLWRRHRDLVDGLVLCATSAGFIRNRVARRGYQSTMLAATTLARAVAGPTSMLPGIPWPTLPSNGLPAWAAAEFRRHNVRMLIEAGHSISTYSARRWIGDVDVPTAVVCTTSDHGVPPDLQLLAAESIRGATVHRVADGHLACASPAFAPPLVDACLDVSSRVG